MRYLQSQVDRRNVRWFASDNSRATLKAIELRSGHLRGLYPFRVDFEYPLSVFAGENGSGKSTLLAISACAFHNIKRGYRLPERTKNYYTFSDFFIQAQGELSPEGIDIGYQILHDNWHRIAHGPAWQSSSKRLGGKWTNYYRRVKRNVIYFGVQRVVPHFERSTHRSYRKRFSPSDMDRATRNKIRKIAGRIIGKTYSDFTLHEHSKYQLPRVSSGRMSYSGFNMGAGEGAVFSILVSLFQAGRGSLLVIDEIELGLHEKAQKRFIHELKRLCDSMHCQIICSTHSPVILESLPPEARFYIECHDHETIITKGISPAYACGKLAGRSSNELTIFVEDDVGGSFLQNILALELRERAQIMPIGSSESVLRQLAARYREGNIDCIAFLDGDKRPEHERSAQKILKYLETRYDRTEEEVLEWIDHRLHYLPGDTWPERWIIQQAIASDDLTGLSDIWGTTGTEVRKKLHEAERAGKHNEFFTLAENLHLDMPRVRSDIIRFVKDDIDRDIRRLKRPISRMLQ